MVINYLGNGSFKLQSGETSLLVNPENARFKADLVLRTLAPAESLKASDGAVEQNDISFSGEYEVKGIEVVGIPVPDESTDKFVKTVYSVNWEDIKFAFLGHVSKPLSADVMDALDEPDVLVLPVGGGHFLEPGVAAKIAKQLEPSYIIPTFYKNPAEFLKVMGQKGEEMEKLVFKKKDLGESKDRVVILK
jgi:L-ascorbate metabolism protein UlaG (beta-lactamase superfamily)